MNDLMVFCTSTEFKYKQYLARIDLWYQQIKNMKADFYVFVDGLIPLQEINKRPQIKFICCSPFLGIKGSWHHSGWKRSIREALKRGRDYKYILHVQSDVMVINPQRLQAKVRQGQNISGWVQDGQYMQTAIMALNDKEVNQKIISYYSTQQNIKNMEITQKRFQTFTDWKYTIKGSNLCLAGRGMSLQKKLKYAKSLDVDYWGQFFYWGFSFDGTKFVWTGEHIR